MHVQCLCIGVYNGADFIKMIEHSLTTFVCSGLFEAMFVRLNSTHHSNAEGRFQRSILGTQKKKKEKEREEEEHHQTDRKGI